MDGLRGGAGGAAAAAGPAGVGVTAAGVGGMDAAEPGLVLESFFLSLLLTFSIIPWSSSPSEFLIFCADVRQSCAADVRPSGDPLALPA